MKHKNDIIMSAFIAAIMASTITSCNGDGDSSSKTEPAKTAVTSVTTPKAADNTEKDDKDKKVDKDEKTTSAPKDDDQDTVNQNGIAVTNANNKSNVPDAETPAKTDVTQVTAESKKAPANEEATDNEDGVIELPIVPIE